MVRLSQFPSENSRHAKSCIFPVLAPLGGGFAITALFFCITSILRSCSVHGEKNQPWK